MTPAQLDDLLRQPAVNYALGCLVTMLTIWAIDAILKSGKAGD